MSDTPPLPRVVALVAAGAVLGSLLRAGVGAVAEAMGSNPTSGWPWGTFIVNIVGCLLMGAFLGRVRVRRHVPPYATPFVATGFLGGLTTFSAFAEETVLLAESGAAGIAVAYAATSLLLGLAAVHAGQLLGGGRL